MRAGRNDPAAARAVPPALVAILLWASFATLGLKLRHIPAFLLVGLALGIGSLLSLGGIRSWFVRPWVLLFGTASFFAYHLFLLLAIRLAPPVEANLINYLWPILIVLLSGIILPGHRLGVRHIVGGLTAFLGAALALTHGRLSFDYAYLPGYALALGAAVVWAVYSVITRKLRPFPNAAVGGFCFFSAVLSLLGHAAFEPSVRLDRSDILLLLALGIGPMGAAFYAWDIALKRGDPRLIGTLAYLTPLLSTVMLSVFGTGVALSWHAIAALVLIVGGAGISASRAPRR